MDTELIHVRFDTFLSQAFDIPLTTTFEDFDEIDGWDF